MRILEHRWTTQRTCTTNCVGQVWTTDCCWTHSSSPGIFNQHGCCSHFAQAPAPTTSTDPFHLRWRWSLLRTTPCLAEPVCSGSWGEKFLRSRGEVPVLSVVTGWIGPPEWAKGESSGLLVQLGGLLRDYRQTAARRGRSVGGSVDEWEHQDRISMQLETLDTGWREFVSDHPPRPGHNNVDDGEPESRRGWQVVSSMCLEERFVSLKLWPRLTLQSRALFRSQGGPLAECALQPVSQSPTTAGSTLSRSACFFYAASGSLFLHCAYLPVWPATRLLWPPPRSVLCGGGFWTSGVGLGPYRRVGQSLSGDSG